MKCAKTFGHFKHCIISDELFEMSECRTGYVPTDLGFRLEKIASCLKPGLPLWILATGPAFVRAPVSCHGSLHQTATRCWPADLRSIAPVQERGWPPGDYCLCQKCFPMQPSLLLPELPVPLFVRERLMIVRDSCSAADCRSSTVSCRLTARLLSAALPEPLSE